ncbi:hypothetical protein Patl1_25547 [Pistacia atlantica]|uniref:Uncharacterized protein n=1 Tax=Pistacia atlantica TaxID=434234 RepID=A0ACC1B579_9ROSI|nr:hypothetical protein Patl1_25547 [Pistacia atlantica]
MDIENVVDVSSFLLVEETADNFLNCQMFHSMVITVDEDDAESCSCDTSEMQASVHEVFDYDIDEADCEFGEVDESERSCSSCKMWLSADGSGYLSKEQGEAESIWVDINLSRQVKDEMEDRLFWETCMAVGYP